MIKINSKDFHFPIDLSTTVEFSYVFLFTLPDIGVIYPSCARSICLPPPLSQLSTISMMILVASYRLTLQVLYAVVPMARPFTSLIQRGFARARTVGANGKFWSLMNEILSITVISNYKST